MIRRMSRGNCYCFLVLKVCTASAIGSDSPLSPIRLASLPINVNVWADLLRARLPSLICRDHWYVRQCFSVSAEECGSTVVSALNGCLVDYSGKMPPVMRSKEESAEWGETITKCLGVRFEERMKQHKIFSPRCSNPSVW